MTRSHRVETIHPFSRRQFLQISATLAIGASLSPLPAFSKSSPKLIERATFTMGSIVTIKAYCEDDRLCNLAIDEAFREMKAVDTLMSVFDEKSQLSVVNREAHQQKIHVDEKIVEVLIRARKISTLTEGAFDVTVEPLMELYGFRDDASIHHFPTDREIASLFDGIGMKNVSINIESSTISLEHRTTKLDFCGIAVGYAIDRAASILKTRGIESAIVNHSGDIFALGIPPDEDAWEVGIIDPQNTEEIITTVHIKNQALSTSGNYENTIVADGRTIGHLLDPRTGRTASSILSGTAIAPTAIEADALSTGLFVLGAEKANGIIQQIGNISFIAVVKEGDEVTLRRF